MSEYSWPWENHQDRAAIARAAWTETVRALPIGTRITGEVVGRQPFGVFLAIDSRPDAVGLARVDAMPRCLDLPAVGRRVTGDVIWHADHNHQVGVTLATWAHHEDPLPAFADRIGQVVTGRVTGIVPIGAFVRIAHCVEGLIPRAELSDAPAGDAEQSVHEGREIAVRIVSVDLERHRISLSARVCGRPGQSPFAA
ncbi:S1 RNA-binding domain-containing protein [Kitasatospora sp. NPDC008115]|uniref:S1 RNA-binding domain-containing protein n=1 Tax=Kitasatospora sp. NPDC008115 TaxID=3364022 RepID=UPI0036EAB3DA